MELVYVDDSPCSFSPLSCWGAWPVDLSKMERSFYHFPIKKLLLLTMTDYEVLPSENVSWRLSFFDRNWGALLLLTIEVHILDIHLYSIKWNHPLIRRISVKKVAFYVSNA